MSFKPAKHQTHLIPPFSLLVHNSHRMTQQQIQKLRNKNNTLDMTEEKPNVPTKVAAQTASIGDREMMTYMLLPSMEMESIQNPAGNDSDDGQFLDGLFEKSSIGFGSSDNGSDDGCKDDSGPSENATVSSSLCHRETLCGVSDNSDSLSLKLVSKTQSSNQNRRFPSPTYSSAAANNTLSRINSSPVGQPYSSVQLPQHLMIEHNYGENIIHNSIPSELSNIPTRIPIPGSQRNFSGVNTRESNGAKAPDSNGAFERYSSWTQNSNRNSENSTHNRDIHNTTSVISSTQHDSIGSASSSTPTTTDSNSRKRKTDSSESHHHNASSKQFETMSAISEDEEEVNKRRIERNMREQERSKKISSQISQLKSLLSSENIRFKPDKYNTLVSVHSYIKTLQQRQAVLDEEKNKLVNTITQSNELVTKSQTGHSTTPSVDEGTETTSGHNIIPNPKHTNSVDEEILVFVRGLDYKNIFSKIQIPLCVTSIDGILLDCNDEFARVCSLSRETLITSGLRKPEEYNFERAESGAMPLTLFNLLANRMSREGMQRVFEAMSSMLKTAQSPSDDVSNEFQADWGVKQIHSDMIKYDHWSTQIQKTQKLSSEMVSFLHFFIPIFELYF